MLKTTKYQARFCVQESLSYEDYHEASVAGSQTHRMAAVVPLNTNHF